MFDWPVGISTGCFYHISIFDCLDDIKRSGFGVIEVSSSPKHLDYHNKDLVKRAAEEIERLGIETYSFHAPFVNDIDISSPDKGKRDYSYREILSAAEAAAILRARYFVIHPGPEKNYNLSGDERVQRMSIVSGAMNHVSRRCSELGIGLIMENMLPHFIFGNTSDMLWIIGNLELENAGACLDTGHALLTGDLYRVMYKLSCHLLMIHASDNNGIEDQHLPPGKGKIDWEQLIAKLRISDFNGMIMLEFNADFNRSNIEILEDALKARLFLRDIMARQALAQPLA